MRLQWEMSVLDGEKNVKILSYVADVILGLSYFSHRFVSKGEIHF